MTNIHFFNLPLACVNVVFGCGARPLEDVDLWLGFVVAALYQSFTSLASTASASTFTRSSTRGPRLAASRTAFFLLYYQIFKLGNYVIALQLGCSAPPPPPPASAWWGESFRRRSRARAPRVSCGRIRVRSWSFFATRVHVQLQSTASLAWCMRN